MGRIVMALSPIQQLIANHINAQAEHDRLFSLEDWKLNPFDRVSAALGPLDDALIAICAARPTDDAERELRSAYLDALKIPSLVDGTPALEDTVYAALNGDGEAPPPDYPDPLLQIVRAYEEGIAASNALPDEVDDPETWRPHWEKLAKSPPTATTLGGAVAALRMLHHEEVTCGNPAFTAPLLSAVLAYFEGGAS